MPSLTEEECVDFLSNGITNIEDKALLYCRKNKIDIKYVRVVLTIVVEKVLRWHIEEDIESMENAIEEIERMFWEEFEKFSKNNFMLDLSDTDFEVVM